MKLEDKRKNTVVYVYNLYEDPGHAWLEVPYNEIVELGIESSISQYSLRNRIYAYLEEDCDLSLFTKTMKDLGREVRYKEIYVEDFETYLNEQLTPAFYFPS